MVYRILYAFVAFAIAALCLWAGNEVTTDPMLLKVWRLFVLFALVIVLLALCGVWPGFMPLDRVR